jgi:hypothetical protein
LKKFKSKQKKLDLLKIISKLSTFFSRLLFLPTFFKSLFCPLFLVVYCFCALFFKSLFCALFFKKWSSVYSFYHPFLHNGFQNDSSRQEQIRLSGSCNHCMGLLYKCNRPLNRLQRHIQSCTVKFVST